MEMSAVVEVQSVRKDFESGIDGERFTAVKDVSFAVAKREIVCICGKTGCGKSTLVNLMLGIDGLTSGSISIEQGDGPYPDDTSQAGRLSRYGYGETLTG